MNEKIPGQVIVTGTGGDICSGDFKSMWNYPPYITKYMEIDLTAHEEQFIENMKWFRDKFDMSFQMLDEMQCHWVKIQSAIAKAEMVSDEEMLLLI